jgi:uncharacterized protein YlzI (FlbEa/FlbD family)
VGRRAQASSHPEARLTRAARQSLATERNVLQMITLHRLGHADESFQLNPDLIVTIESTPDTVVSLATTAKVVVSETPEQVADLVRAWRVEVLSEALRTRRPQREPSHLRSQAQVTPISALDETHSA